MERKKFVSGLTRCRGFRATGGSCGVKRNGKPDLALIVSDVSCSAASVFTTNRMTSAAVDLDRRHLEATGGRARAIVCNSGNANASTGSAGRANALLMCAQVARLVGCKPTEVLVASTGVIGRPLPIEKITAGIKTLWPNLARGSAADRAAARAIMSTDLVEKSACRKVTLNGKPVHLAGIAKGSGMIAPNMATMLAFITTDAAISARMLHRALSTATAVSFNRISVDHHTSPSDTAVVLASNLAGHRSITSPGREFAAFSAALTEICHDLAYQMVKDGEGATKVFRVEVVRAATEHDADRIGRAIVDSPLVKTAVHGGDPNWGRITTAAGNAGSRLIVDKLSLFIGTGRGPFICVFRRGGPTLEGQSPSARLLKVMKQKEITFRLDVGLGRASASWLGCDLSRQYVAINADYTS